MHRYLAIYLFVLLVPECGHVLFQITKQENVLLRKTSLAVRLIFY